MRVLVVGGGYAGLVATLDLVRSGAVEVCLVDAQPCFTDVIRLQETLRRPMDELRLPFNRLAQRHGFRFRQQRMELDPGVLCRRMGPEGVRLPEWDEPFDYLVMATGSRATVQATGNLFGLEQLRHQGLAPLLEGWLAEADADFLRLSLVGGGSTALQFLFEVDDWLRGRKAAHLINFLHAGDRPLAELPAPFSDYVVGKIRSRAGTLRYLPDCRFLAQEEASIRFQSRQDAQQRRLPSQLTLAFTGVRPEPADLQSNPYGQIVYQGRVLDRVFAAGDCSRFQGDGLDSLSAQAAVRKAKRVAGNILSHAAGETMRPYAYQELGYFVGLGETDAVGWALLRETPVCGLAAAMAKAAIEEQFDLYLKGIDVFFDPSSFNPA